MGRGLCGLPRRWGWGAPELGAEGFAAPSLAAPKLNHVSYIYICIYIESYRRYIYFLSIDHGTKLFRLPSIQEKVTLARSLSRDIRRAEDDRAAQCLPISRCHVRPGHREALGIISRRDIPPGLWAPAADGSRRPFGSASSSVPGLSCSFRNPYPLPRPRALPSRCRHKRDPSPPPPS